MSGLIIFFRLLPYIALSLGLSYFLAGVPQSREYLALIRESAASGVSAKLAVKYAVINCYYLLFVFLVGKSLQDIVIDNGGLARSSGIRFAFWILFVVTFTIPILLVAKAVFGAQGPIGASDLTILGFSALGLAGIVAVAIKVTRIERFGYRMVAEPYFTNLSIAICVLLLAALVISNAIDVVRMSQNFGAIGILIGALCLFQGSLLLLAHYRKRGYPVLSILVSVIIIGQFATALTGPKLVAALTAPAGVKLAAVKAGPPPDARKAFADWLNARRPAIEGYASRYPGKKYPIFVVAAQGGGYYAAYHTALFLARLQDRCPAFSAHTFAISSVSGGSLGAALFDETLRYRKAGGITDAPCRTGSLAEPAMETTVRRFFDFDFLTPLIASTLLFDIPASIVPAIRLGPDRGTALQKSFEAAWQGAADTDSGGFSDLFYGRWKADEAIPALFLNTTNVSLGVAHLISELDLRASSRYTTLAYFVGELRKQADPGATVDANILEQMQEHIGFSQLSFVNTLQFNKEPVLPLSAAVTSSARFPYITPSSLIEGHNRSENSLFDKLKYMQLLDGGMVDNSGLFIATEIKTAMDDLIGVPGEPEFAGLRDKVSIELISFGHEAAALYKPGDEGSVAEFVAPLIAFDRIRMSRRYSYQALAEQKYKTIHEVVLFDGAFNAPLSWSLSNSTKHDIENRAGGLDGDSAVVTDKLCCLVKPGKNASQRLYAFTEGENGEGVVIAFKPEEEQSWRTISEKDGRIVNQTYIANSSSFMNILRELGYTP
jgi:hypothetical protein